MCSWIKLITPWIILRLLVPLSKFLLYLRLPFVQPFLVTHACPPRGEKKSLSRNRFSKGKACLTDLVPWTTTCRQHYQLRLTSISSRANNSDRRPLLPAANHLSIPKTNCRRAKNCKNLKQQSSAKSTHFTNEEWPNTNHRSTIKATAANQNCPQEKAVNNSSALAEQ